MSLLPAWLRQYHRADLPGDITAGIVVAIMLVPQGMAYALLAGLPPQLGLYASTLPPLLYAVLGSSNFLAVGPVAIASLMTATTLAPYAGGESQLAAAMTLALLVGLLMLLTSVLRLGSLVNYLGHPVISGFTSGAAVVIAVSQLAHLTGLHLPAGLDLFGKLRFILGHLGLVNGMTTTVGVGAIILLILLRRPLAGLLGHLHAPSALIETLTRTGALLVVVIGTLFVALLDPHLETGIQVIGDIPSSLPAPKLPHLDAALWQELLPDALMIAVIGFLESIAIAKALASKRRQKIAPNRELLALGVANLGAGLVGAYPVAGGFGRSSVNFHAGANTQLAAIITAILILLCILLFSPLFYYLPKAVLAAIVMMAVARLLDLDSLVRAWRYNRADALALLVTFAGVLVLGVEAGLLAGAMTAIALYLWRTSRPHIAIVGRVGKSEHFRNILRHDVHTCPHILALRVDESLYFANAEFLQQRILEAVADHPQVEHVVLIASAVNFIDYSALESLQGLVHQLRDAGVRFHLAEVKGPVMDMLQRSGLLQELGAGRVFLSTHQALDELGCPAV